MIILEVIPEARWLPNKGKDAIIRQYRPTKLYINIGAAGIHARHGPEIDVYYPDLNVFAAWGCPIHGELTYRGLWLKVPGFYGHGLPVEHVQAAPVFLVKNDGTT